MMRPDMNAMPEWADRLGAVRGVALLAAVAGVLGVFWVGAAAQSGAATDRAALEALYNATDGANWADSTNWLTDAPLSEWYGVSTDGDGRVTKLELEFNSLTGTLPGELGRLTNLEWLSIAENRRGRGRLTGPIPGELGRLTNLEFLNLGRNSLTGPIPNLERLTNLQYLYLWDNFLTGPIPDWFGNMVNIDSLLLGPNPFTPGPIPDWLRNLTNLSQLSLSRTNRRGPVPDWIGNLTELNNLYLGINELTGPIPDSLGNLTGLWRLHLDNTGLTGPIPGSLGNLTELGELDLGGSWGLSGQLPAGLGPPWPWGWIDISLTQVCAPWSEREPMFVGRMCGEGEEDRVIVDVAVVYTPAAREATGGTAEIDAVIDLMIAETNLAYQASGVRHRVRLAGRSEVQYVETSPSGFDLIRLADPSDGHMDEAHALRDRVGADLVHLIVGRANVGGIAEFGGAFGLTIHDGGGETFAHELGHNMQLAHDRYVVYHYEGGTGPHPAYGYVNQTGLNPGAEESRRWLTVMAYHYQCSDVDITCQRIFRFSNPRQRYNGDPIGVPFGTSWSGVTGSADAATVLNTTMPLAALYRDRVARPNSPPTVADPLLDRTLPLTGTLAVDVSRAFADVDGDPLAYSVSSSAPDVVTVLATALVGAGPRLILTAVSAGAATIRVTATDPGGLSASQSFAVTVRPSFTDYPVRPGVTPIRAVHFTELRTRIDGLRQAAGLTLFGWTDPVLRAGVTPVRLVHLLELRRALAAAYTASGRTPPRWTDAAPTPGTTPIRAAHLNELRAAVVALE